MNTSRTKIQWKTYMDMTIVVAVCWHKRVKVALGLTPLDIHIPREEVLYSIAPRDRQDSGKTPSRAHGKFYGRSKVGLLVPYVLSIRCREQHTSTEESLDEATNSGRVDGKGKT